LSVGRTVKDPVTPSTPDSVSTVAFGSTAARDPLTNDARQIQRPALSGERCARHFVPSSAEVSPAWPSAAK
jgi:hypothetical protein